MTPHAGYRQTASKSNEGREMRGMKGGLGKVALWGEAARGGELTVKVLLIGG
jgi:hypothetical protein